MNGPWPRTDLGFNTPVGSPVPANWLQLAVPMAGGGIATLSMPRRQSKESFADLKASITAQLALWEKAIVVDDSSDPCVEQTEQKG